MAYYLPKRRKRQRLGLRESPQIKCPSHLKWVRGHECCVASRGIFALATGPGCSGRIEAHHVKTRGAGGGDEQVVPLCSYHHARLDSPGWSSKKFEAVYMIDMREIAAGLWLKSPHRKKYEQQRERAA